jgi:hypothetical protein
METARKWVLRASPPPPRKAANRVRKVAVFCAIASDPCAMEAENLGVAMISAVLGLTCRNAVA